MTTINQIENEYIATFTVELRNISATCQNRAKILYGGELIEQAAYWQELAQDLEELAQKTTRFTKGQKADEEQRPRLDNGTDGDVDSMRNGVDGCGSGGRGTE